MLYDKICFRIKEPRGIEKNGNIIKPRSRITIKYRTVVAVLIRFPICAISGNPNNRPIIAYYTYCEKSFPTSLVLPICKKSPIQ